MASSFPKTECFAFVIAITWVFAIASSSETVPSTVSIALLSNKYNSQEWKTFHLAIDHINSNKSVLPNTTVKAFEGEMNQDNILEYALNISKFNVVALLLDSQATATHDALSSMLRIPLVTTLPSGAEHFRYAVRMSPSSHDVTEAIRGIISYYKWTNLLVLYDVRWRHSAHKFVYSLPPKTKVSKIALELDHHNQPLKLCEETKRKLSGLNDVSIEAFVVFLENQWIENIINQVHCACSLKIEKPHNWLLADPVASSGMEVQSSQVVMGFQPYKSNSHVTQQLKAQLLPFQEIKDSSFLLYDAVWTVAHALQALISAGKWENSSSHGLQLAPNGATLLEYLKNVQTRGTTDRIQFNSSGSRINSKLDVKNLRNNKFVTGCLLTGCLNGGSCLFDKIKETFTCSCKLQWKGDKCIVNTCQALGVADNNTIPDARIMASTHYNSDHYPYYGRLNGTRGCGAWCPNTTSNRTEYLQVDMGAVRSVCAVATQGERIHNDWTKSFKLQLSSDGATWKSYKEHNTEKIGQWNSSQNKLHFSSTPEQNRQTSGLVPLDKLNRRLKVVVVKDAPFVIENKDGELEGFSIDLIAKIAELLSFRYEIYLSPDGLYGGWNEKTGYTGIVGEITKNRADLSTSPLTINSERLKVLEFSKPFMQFTMSLISKKLDTNNHDLTTFMLPYSTEVWLLTLACLLFVTVLMYLVNFFSPYGHRSRHKHHGETGEEFDFYNSLWFCLASMLQQGADHTPKSFSGRVLAGCFWFCILIWISTYTANLAAFFTVRNSERQINTLEDVVEGDYPFYIMRDSAIYEFFRVAEYHTYRKLWERMNAAGTFVNSTDVGYETARTVQNAVFMSEKPSTDYVISQKPCDLRTVNGILGAGSYGIAMPKHSPYIRNISVAILKLQETSVLDSLERKWWEYKSQCPKDNSQRAVGESKGIQLENMLGVYLVMAAGGCISVILVLAEIWWRKHGSQCVAVLRTKFSFMREKTTTIIRVEPSPHQSKNEEGDHNDKDACEATPC